MDNYGKKTRSPGIAGILRQLLSEVLLALRGGARVTVMAVDAPFDRAIMGEFRNYLEQRASAEGWEYRPENFEVKYRGTAPHPLDDLYNLKFFDPKGKNAAFEEVRPGVFRRLRQDRADRLRDELDLPE